MSRKTVPTKHVWSEDKNAFIDDRLSICKTCNQFRKCRCIKIELGCKNAFDQYIRNPNTACPLCKWNKNNK